MAAFSYHYPASLDSFLLPNVPIKMSLLDEDMNITCFPHWPPNAVENSSHEYLRKAHVAENPVDSSSGGLGTDSSSMIAEVENDYSRARLQNTMDKKRKNRDQNFSSCVQSKDQKGRKQKKCGGNSKNGEEKPKIDKQNSKGASQEPPTGYIHVRARRGQATDSHSLAERVRREKISERMKLLQGLVPGCDKVTGKALMLDEIINYVQSLQHQVEFLSMKLASVNPVYYEFSALDLDQFVLQSEKPGALPSEVPFVQQSNQSIQTSFADSTAPAFPETNNYPLLESSPSVLHPGQGPNCSVVQDNVNLLSWDIEGQRSSFPNPAGYSNLCSFLTR